MLPTTAIDTVSEFPRWQEIARAGLEPATLRSKGVDSNNAPPCLTFNLLWHSFMNAYNVHACIVMCLCSNAYLQCSTYPYTYFAACVYSAPPVCLLVRGDAWLVNILLLLSAWGAHTWFLGGQNSTLEARNATTGRNPQKGVPLERCVQTERS